MSNEDNSSQESPIHYSEVLIAVLAALAIEQAAQSLFAVILKDPSSKVILRAMVLTILVIFTTIRFYHGNSIYLTRTYSNAPYNLVLPGGLIVASLAQFLDLIAHMIQYLVLVGCASFISHGSAQNYFGASVLVLYLVDVAWISVIMRRNRDEKSIETLRNWFWVNLVTLIVLALILYGRQSNFWVAAVLLATGIIDYCWNYNHYFSTMVTNDPKIISVFHASSMEYVTLSETIQTIGFKGDSASERFNNYCQDLFLYFMENISARQSLFLDPYGKYHVGIYFEKNGLLFPVFRYYDKEIKITNRIFARGESYVGDAFNNDDPQNTAICYNSRQDEKVFKNRQIEDDQKNYNSGVLAKIILDDGNQQKPVGVLNVTSSKENSFVDTIHNLMFKNIAQKIALILKRDEIKDVLEHFKKIEDYKPHIVESGVIK
ncbi:MAG: hypothetical protein WA705_18600 [Candidatus Ozemobacteraceae bacterium]